MFEFERTTTSKPVHYVRDIRDLHVDESENQRFHIAYANAQGIPLPATNPPKTLPLLCVFCLACDC